MKGTDTRNTPFAGMASMRTVGYDDRDRGKRGVQPADRTSGCVGVIGSE